MGTKRSGNPARGSERQSLSDNSGAANSGAGIRERPPGPIVAGDAPAPALRRGRPGPVARRRRSGAAVRKRRPGAGGLEATHRRRSSKGRPGAGSDRAKAGAHTLDCTGTVGHRRVLRLVSATRNNSAHGTVSRTEAHEGGGCPSAPTEQRAGRASRPATRRRDAQARRNRADE